MLLGKARGKEAPQRHVYKRVSERNGVQVALCAVKQREMVTWSRLASQGARSVWLECRVDVRKLAEAGTLVPVESLVKYHSGRSGCLT